MTVDGLNLKHGLFARILQFATLRLLTICTDQIAGKLLADAMLQWQVNISHRVFRLLMLNSRQRLTVEM